jgi:plasmid stabilization system protein ParE
MGPRRRRVIWTERAVASVDDAVAFVGADSPTAAERLLIRILDSAESLSELTERGRIVPEIDDPQVRELIIPPYRLVYQYDESQVQLLALLHSAQEFILRRTDRNG